MTKVTTLSTGLLRFKFQTAVWKSYLVKIGEGGRKQKDYWV